MNIRILVYFICVKAKIKLTETKRCYGHTMRRAEWQDQRLQGWRDDKNKLCPPTKIGDFLDFCGRLISAGIRKRKYKDASVIFVLSTKKIAESNIGHVSNVTERYRNGGGHKETHDVKQKGTNGEKSECYNKASR